MDVTKFIVHPQNFYCLGLSAPERLRVEEDFSWICAALQPYSAHWKAIAYRLGFTEAEVATIAARPLFAKLDSPYVHLQAMLFRWLQWFPGDVRCSKYYPTLEYLQTALDEAVTNKPRIAERCKVLLENAEQKLRWALTQLTLPSHIDTGIYNE